MRRHPPRKPGHHHPLHGGPIAEPEDYAYVHKYVPKLAGFYGASSIERIPVETDVMHTVREYKALSLKT